MASVGAEFPTEGAGFDLEGRGLTLRDILVVLLVFANAREMHEWSIME